MSVLRLCLLALLPFIQTGTSLPSPVLTTTLRPPHLEVSDAEGKTTRMHQDVATVFQSAHCPHDLTLDLLYSDRGRPYFPPELKAPRSQAFVDVYNGNIDLLSLIKFNGWLNELCTTNIIKDLSSQDFCSELKIEEFLEEGFIAAMNKTLTKLGFSEIMRSASELQKLKGEEECKEVCGGRYKNVLCLGFTSMSTFLMDQVIKYDNQLLQQKEAPSGQATESDTPNTAVTQPSATDTPNTAVTQPSTTDTPNTAVTQPSTPDPNIVRSGTKQFTLSEGGTTPPSDQHFSDVLEKAIDKYLSDPHNVEDLRHRIQPTAATRLPLDPQGNDNSGPSGGQVKDQKDIPLVGQPNSQVGYQQVGLPGSQTVDQSGQQVGLPGSQTVDQSGQQDDLPGSETDDQSGLPGSPKSGTPSVPTDVIVEPSNVDHSGPQVENNDPGNNQPAIEVIPQVIDEDDDEFSEIPLPTSLPAEFYDDESLEDGEGDVTQRVDVTTPTTEKLTPTEPKNVVYNNANIMNKEDVIFEEEEEPESSGYGSMHFFSIILVVVIFAIGAYLCMHNRKKIKESLKDYVSDSQKRRRTRDYKPLLSGKK